MYEELSESGTDFREGLSPWLQAWLEES